MQNIEIKYQLPNRAGLETSVRSHEDIEFQYTQTQRDIYFGVPEGRLKIRIQDELKPHLIRYQRTNEARERLSDYEITYLDDVDREIDRLSAQFGLIGEVIKQRTLYLFRNVRIHLDQVEGLGSYLEFESVLSDSCNHQQAQQNLSVLNGRLQDSLGDPESVSYIDLISEKLRA